MEELENLLKNNIQSSADFTSGSVEVQDPTIPLSPSSRSFGTPILHRSYENTNAPVRVYWFNDRVEVQDPGGPYGQVTKGKLGPPGVNDYRNPNLAGVMKELGYVQRFGFGISVARNEMNKNGDPPLEFQVEDALIAVILRRRHEHSGHCVLQQQRWRR